MDDTVLKGGVSYNKYVWHSSGGCEACNALDGTEYDYEDNIPDRPHPNCQCWIEEVKNGEDEEPCDCWNKIQAILDEADELEGDLSSSLDKIETIQDEIELDLAEYQSLLDEVQNVRVELMQTEPCGEGCFVTGMAANISYDFDIKEFAFVFDYGYETIAIIEAGIETFNIFQANKTEMENTANSYDKYYHAKANCESAELGAIEALWAVVWSIGKEIIDIFRKAHAGKMKFKDIIKDSMEDLQADLYGLQKAKEHGYCSDKVKDAGDIFKK